MNKKVTNPTYTETHTMYNLFPLMARTAVVCVVPKAIDAIHSALFKPKKIYGATNKVTINGKRTRVRTKKVDMTPITRQHYDIVVVRHNALMAFNKGKPLAARIKNPLFIAGLNEEFGMDKSATAFSAIYTGKIQREDLVENDERLILNTIKFGQYTRLIK